MVNCRQLTVGWLTQGVNGPVEGRRSWEWAQAVRKHIELAVGAVPMRA